MARVDVMKKIAKYLKRFMTDGVKKKERYLVRGMARS
jgi:hypothetical protein